MGVKKVVVRIGEGEEFALQRNAYAFIDPKECVNCGECRAACPVEAIQENQREVCRICPGCADKPGLPFDKMRELSVKHACTIGCPLGISPQGYINLARAGKFQEAYDIIYKKTPFPGVLAYICHHPCEDECKRGIFMDEPLQIRELKKYLVEVAAPDKVEPYPVIYDEEIAIIGAGPAGLSAAHALALKGYQVTVFDEAAEAGGMLVRGIPTFRLPREVVEWEIAALQEAGIKIKLNCRIGKDMMKELREEFDAVLVATGAPNSKKLKIDGWYRDSVFTAVDFMERVNTNGDLWRHPGQEFVREPNVVVIGGGSVAMDVARSALRYGAKSVTAVCMECGVEVPAHPWEVEEAKAEGVQLMEGWQPKRFVGERAKLDGVEVIQVKSMSRDAEGHIACEVVPGTEQVVPADLIIEAIGQAPDAVWKAYEDEDDVFFAGDVHSVKLSVVDAMASGTEAARKIDGKLRGGELKDEAELRKLFAAPIEEKIYPATRVKYDHHSVPVEALPDLNGRMRELVSCDLSDEDAQVEISRCLQCGYSWVDPARCIGCGTCQLVCPKGNVITMVRDNGEEK